MTCITEELELTGETVLILHEAAQRKGDRLAWLVEVEADGYAARPRSIRHSASYNVVVRAATLDDLRDRLPHGLYRVPGRPGPGSPVVECWL